MPDLFSFAGSGTLVVFAGIVVFVLLLAYLGSRYKVASVEEALVISGRSAGRTEAGTRRLKVVRGGGTIVYPLVNRVSKLQLTARQIQVALSDAVSRQGIKVSVQGVATVKIGGDEDSILAAAERFVGREDQIDSIVKNVLEGSLRSIVGTLTVEELNLDRQKFQQAVQDAAKGDLATSGLTIDNFTIQAIRDEVGYMDLIGQQETARRERDARMAKATADQEAAVREAEAQQVKLNAQRDVELREAEVLTQVQAAEARAGQAGPLAQAEAQQEVTRRQTELAQLEADRKQQELVASTVRPAEAEAEAQVRRAEGDKQARIAQAQAEAERVKLAGQAEAAVQVTKGEAQARVVEVNAEATAKQTSLEGNAEAGVVLSKGEAEAKALALRAEAYRQFNEAAVIQTVLSMLPDIVRAAAEPMGNIDSLTVLSSDGASDVVRTTTRTVAEAGTAVKGLTGIDIPGLLANAMGTAVHTNGGSPATPTGSDGGAGTGGTGRPGAGDGRSTPPPAAAAGPGVAPAAGDAARHGASVAASGMSGSAASVRAAPAVDPGAAFERAGRAMAEASKAAGASAAAPAPAAAPLPAASGAATPPAGRTSATDRAIAAPRPAGRATMGSRPTPAVAGIGPDTTVDEAAARLAADLRAVPGIERYGTVRLRELDRSGPRPLRTMWRIARDRLDDRWGQITIGEILESYGDAGPGGARPSA